MPSPMLNMCSCSTSSDNGCLAASTTATSSFCFSVHLTTILLVGGRSVLSFVSLVCASNVVSLCRHGSTVICTD